MKVGSWRMTVNIIGQDIRILRKMYDEALKQQGIPVKYQFPNLATSNHQGEPVIDSYSEPIECFVFFDGSPKIKTLKRYGWVVENDENLPFLIHCSFHLPNLQRDSLFTIGGQYSELPDRQFRVTEMTYDLQAPDHIVCQVVPVYEQQTVGQTDREIATKFNKSNYFIRPKTDYRGQPIKTTEDGANQ